MRSLTRLSVAAVVALAMTTAGYGVEARVHPASRPLGPETVTVRIDVEHSRFTPAELDVRRGTKVRFVVDNDDPINHELIVGSPAVHDRHRDGAEAKHSPVPGEVSVAAGHSAVTSYTFTTPGRVEFACHLPGHYDYGMRGTVNVVD